MTRKEEIREAAKIDYKAVEREAYWLAEQKFEDTFIQAVRYVRFVKFLASKNIITAPGLTAPESSPKEKKVGGMATVYPLGNEVVSLTKPEGWIDGVGVQSSTAEEENCNAFTDFTKDEESSPAPLESQEELWDEVFSKIPPHNLDDFERRLELLKSKFILTRRTEGKGRTEGDLEKENT